MSWNSARWRVEMAFGERCGFLFNGAELAMLGGTPRVEVPPVEMDSLSHAGVSYDEG